ncbi:hypothetical protein [Nostoc sp.]
MNIGWQELTRIFGCIIYVEIKAKFGSNAMERKSEWLMN